MHLKKLVTFCFLIFIYSCNPDKVSDKKMSAVPDSSAHAKQYRDPKNYFRDCKLLLNEATRMDSTLYQQLEVNQALGNEAIKAFTDYAYYCGNDSLSPIFLIKTAQIATSLNNIPQAKIALDKCIADYPKFKSVSAAIFLLAQLYDEQNYLNNEEEARRLYQEIIDKYPNSAEASSAKGALKFIGKTDKEMIDQLKKEGKNISIH